jgi:hypothetical protein
LWLRNREDHLKYMFQGPDDFNRLNARGREILWPRLQDWSMFRWKENRVGNWEEFSRLDVQMQNRRLWQIVNQIADPVTVRPQFFMSENDVEINLELCDQLLGKSEWNMIDVKSPQFPSRMRKPGFQLKAIVKALLLNDRIYTTENELEIIMTTTEMSRVLKTRQSTWRIFRYYKPVLEQLGVLR